MNTSVRFTNFRIETSLGCFTATTERLFAGDSAIMDSSSYGLDVPMAQFPNQSLRFLGNAVKKIFGDVVMPPADESLFIYAAAKGDLSQLSGTYWNSDFCADAVSPRLDLQAEKVCELIGWQPARTITVSCACASGAIAIETAVAALEDNRYKYAVIFGFDPISGFVATGFNSLSALSPDGARPFDKTRTGLTLGECAALLILSGGEPENGDIVVAGCGTSNDANHRTGPSRDGSGLSRAVNSALVDALLLPSDIGAIKCHGTATPYNDAMEAKAMFTIFGDKIPPMVSTKGALGHMSGGGALAEIILATEFLRRKSIPPTKGFTERGVDEAVSISSSIQQFENPYVLCLSAGFGGINAAVILSEVA